MEIHINGKIVALTKENLAEIRVGLLLRADNIKDRVVPCSSGCRVLSNGFAHLGPFGTNQHVSA